MVAALEKSPPLQPSHTTFSFCYSLPVKLKWNLIQQNWSVMIQALKNDQGTKFGTCKKPKFSLFDVIIFWFNGIRKQRFIVWLLVSNIWNIHLPSGNRRLLMQKKKIIAPGYYLRKYSISLCTLKAYKTVLWDTDAYVAVNTYMYLHQNNILLCLILVAAKCLNDILLCCSSLIFVMLIL